MDNEEAIQFKNAIEKICGEANEAARLAPMFFKDDELKIVKRELARLMEVVESRILPSYKRQFPLDSSNKNLNSS